MRVDIDLVADAASMIWGDRTGGSSTLADVPGRGVRLLLNAAGDVVGIEVLGWSQRAGDPANVGVRVTASAEVLAPNDPLAAALNHPGPAIPAVTAAGRPVDENQSPMLTLREAAEQIGQDRSWISRQLNAGKLRGRKIGNEWWTTHEWIQDYIDRHRAS